MTTDAPVYALYHRTCGHILGVSAERGMLERQRDALATVGHHRYRTRRAGDDDVEALVRGDRCEFCTIDGVATVETP